MQNKSNHKNILILKAKEDFDAAKKLIKEGIFSEEIVLFHCQQAIEKALKAFLDSNGLIYPKSHDLEALLSMCGKEDPTFENIGYITTLTPFAVDIRYDEFIEIKKEEILEFIKQTETALSFILGKIPSK
ncbi:MAG: HEPN domain-containing protein [bacterium]